MDPKYPDVRVDLLAGDGSAFSIMGAVCKGLKRAGHGDAVEAFTEEASSGDYDHLLRVVMSYVQTVFED